MRKILYLLSSARKNGNSERLAVRTVPQQAKVQWCDLANLALPGFVDLRPRAAEIPSVLSDVLDLVFQSDDIVFVAPVYWYGLPAPAKLFLDHWSGFLDHEELRFKERLAGKRLWLISSRADPNLTVPRAMEEMLRLSGEWLGMTWGGALHGIGDEPGDVEACPAWDLAGEFLTP